MNCNNCKNNSILRCSKGKWSAGELSHQEKVQKLRTLIADRCDCYDARENPGVDEFNRQYRQQWDGKHKEAHDLVPSAIEEDVVDSIISWLDDEYGMFTTGELIRSKYPRRYS